MGPGRTGDILCRPDAAPPLLGSEAASAGPQAPPSAPPAGSAASASPALEHPVHGIATTSIYTAVVLWATYPFQNAQHSLLVVIITVFKLEVTEQLTECLTTQSKALPLLLEVNYRCCKESV